MDQQQLRATIASARGGDASAYETLLDAYAPRLYGYFLRATGNHHEAEDLLGEVMLRLVRTLDGYDEKGRFEPWLFRIAANLVRDRIRRLKSRPASVSLSADDADGEPMADRLDAEARDVDHKLVEREQSQQLQDALGKLDETTREMILLRHFGGLSFKQLAETFDCPLGTALAKVHRGIKALGKWMNDER